LRTFWGMLAFNMKTSKFLCVVLGLSLTVSAAGLVGCASTSDRSRTRGQYHEDKKLADNVKDALKHDPIYKYPNVDVSVNRGKVQLSGFAATEPQKAEAARVTSGVQGVTQVENSISLTTPVEAAEHH
jgi:hyperosmotically inducible protein